AAARRSSPGSAARKWSQDPLAGVVESGDHLGAAVVVGDFNHDGFADLAIDVPDEDVGSDADGGAVHVVYGGPTGLTVAATQDFTQGDLGDSTGPGDRFGFSLAAGDLNGDGMDDLVIGAPGKDVLADGQLRVDAGARLRRQPGRGRRARRRGGSRREGARVRRAGERALPLSGAARALVYGVRPALSNHSSGCRSCRVRSPSRSSTPAASRP
ncbi:MAG TPA: hypothetical protein VGV61_08715, partial [Thermoanaerobaculia bacterium]|nr:hypothetical protein [Thermoanaerobaculia bacterium]